MNIELERSQIIEELNHVNDEWLLKAIKRLLGLDYPEDDIPEEYKRILDDRMQEYDAGRAETMGLDEAKKRLLGK